MNKISLLYLTYIENPFAPENKGVMAAQVKSLLKEIGKKTASISIVWLSLASTKIYTPTIEEIKEYQSELQKSHVTFLYEEISGKSFIKRLIHVYKIFNKVLQDYKPHIVHSRVYPGSFLALLNKVFSPFPYKIIFDGRGVYPEQLKERSKGMMKYIKYFVWKGIEQLLIRYTDASIGVTPFYADYLRSLSSKSNIRYIPCCVDTSLFNIDFHEMRVALRKKHAIPQDALVFVYSGTLATKYSSPEVLAHILNHLQKEHPTSYFLILTKSDITDFKTCLNSQVINQLIVKGLEPHEVPSYLVLSDIGILVREKSLVNSVAMPVKLGEYLAAGLPIICSSSLKGVAQIIQDNHVGLVFNLEEIISFNIDHLLQTEKKQCTTLAQSFSSQYVAEQYMLLYKDLMDSCR